MLYTIAQELRCITWPQYCQRTWIILNPRVIQMLYSVAMQTMRAVSLSNHSTVWFSLEAMSSFQDPTGQGVFRHQTWPSWHNSGCKDVFIHKVSILYCVLSQVNQCYDCRGRLISSVSPNISIPSCYWSDLSLSFIVTKVGWVGVGPRKGPLPHADEHSQ